MLLEKLKAGVKNVRDVAFYGHVVRLRILSEDELQRCRTEAQTHAAKLKLDEEGTYAEIALRQLYLSLADPDGGRVAESADAFRRLVTRADREYLIAEYLALERECSPALAALTEEEFARIREDVKKNPDSILSGSNTALLRRLTAFLESRPSI